MEEKKKFELDDKKKKLIALAAAILVLILIILLLLRSCGGSGEGNNNSDGGSSEISASSVINTDDDDTDDDSSASTPTSDPVTDEIGHDEELVATWYLEVNAMVLVEEGYGSLYFGDEDGGEFEWYTSGNRLTFVTEEKTYSATYVIDGDNLTLTYDDGKVETWFR